MHKKAKRGNLATKLIPYDDEQAKRIAMLAAMAVRNAMEEFHAKYLSDDEMRELNPIIRNAIYTTFYALARYNTSKAAKLFIDFNQTLIPSYWEPPQLVDYPSTDPESDFAETLAKVMRPPRMPH